MKRMLAVFLFSFSFVTAHAQAGAPAGTWKFDRAEDYYGRAPANLVSKFNVVSIRDKEIRFSPECAVQFRAEDYLFSDVFQSLSQDDVTEKKLDVFLSKKLGLSVAGAKEVYKLAGAPATCARPVMRFFVLGERLVIPSGATLYSYVRDGAAGTNAAASQTAALPLFANYKVSKLPMDFDRYLSQCKPKIADRKGHPQTSDKCAPEFYPYVADPKSADPLMQIIGNHNYGFNGQQYTEGFSPPFKQKVAATFLVFPSMNNVALVRVDDFDVVRNEERDVMTGVYLSIVNGKVVDQISGCHLDQNYRCIEEGTPVAKLKENGKFERLVPR